MSDSKSKTPSGEFVFSQGSTYELPGFPGGEAEGPRTNGGDSNIVHPQTGSYAQLPGAVLASDTSLHEAPDGIVRLEDGFSLAAMMDEGYVDPTDIVDLRWLDPAQPQDPDRLPYFDFDSIPELEEQWADRRANSLNRIPNAIDRESTIYHQTVAGEYEPVRNDVLDAWSSNKIAQVFAHAVRQTSQGASYDAVFNAVNRQLGGMSSRVASSMHHLQQERGLLGNVYICADAHPDFFNGKWDSWIQKHASNARYIVASEGSTGLVHFRGRPIVSEVPWGEAFDYYAPLMRSAGYTIPDKGSPKQRLQAAFLYGVPQEVLSRVAEFKPTAEFQGARYTAQQAYEIAKVTSFTPKVVSKEALAEKAARKACETQLAGWQASGLLSKEEVSKLAAINLQPQEILRAASELILVKASAQSVYTGSGLLSNLDHLHTASEQDVWDMLAHREAAKIAEDQAFEAAMRRKMEVDIQRWQDGGQLTPQEGSALRQMLETQPPNVVAKYASELITDLTRDLSYMVPEAQDAPLYSLPTFEDARAKTALRPQVVQQDPFMVRVASRAREYGVKPAVIHQVLKWARVHMSEGSLGDELDLLLTSRFTDDVRQASAPFLHDLRKEHEGLSGLVYVDAAAYGSEGLKGCEEGALRHRANPLKYVLAMSKCANCVFQNQDGFCTKYAKRLVSQAPVENKASFQKEAIRLANAPDAEVVQSLFANTYQNDFDLSYGGNIAGVLWGDGDVDFE